MKEWMTRGLQGHVTTKEGDKSFVLSVLSRDYHPHLFFGPFFLL